MPIARIKLLFSISVKDLRFTPVFSFPFLEKYRCYYISSNQSITYLHVDMIDLFFRCYQRYSIHGISEIRISTSRKAIHMIRHIDNAFIISKHREWFIPESDFLTSWKQTSPNVKWFFSSSFRCLISKYMKLHIMQKILYPANYKMIFCILNSNGMQSPL